MWPGGSPLRIPLSPLTDGPSSAHAARTVRALYSAWKLAQASILPQPHKALINKWEGIFVCEELTSLLHARIYRYNRSSRFRGWTT